MAEVTTADVVDAIVRDQRLCGFVRHGRVASMPAKRSRRVLLLGEIARLFEPGLRYSEQDVNQQLGALFDDYAALRRYLVDEGMLDRARGDYWRSGGPVGL